MKVFLSKMKHRAADFVYGVRARLEPVGLRVRSEQRKKRDVLRDGRWLRYRVQADAGLRQAFPERITHSNLNKWWIRPVDTWQREQEIESLMDRFHFSFDSVLAIRNPYGLSPLCCLVLFETAEPYRVRYTVRGKTPGSTFTHTLKRETCRHRVPVFGLYASYQNVVLLELLDENGKAAAEKELVIPVGTVSKRLDTLVESVCKNEDTAMPFVFVTGGYSSSTYAFDVNGDVRFLLSRTPRQYGVYPLPDGRFLFSDRNINRPTYNNPHALVLYDMDFLGRVRETYYVKEGVHHWAVAQDGTEGNIILGATSSLEEKLMEGTMLAYDRRTGETVHMYNLGDYFPKELQKKYDWAHLNRIYCQDERYLILSLRNVSTVVKFDLREEKIVWLLTHPDVYAGTELAGRVLRPVGDDFHYFLQQHAVEIVDTGLTEKGQDHVIEMMLFDNHCNTKRKVSWFDGKTESYACFYKIDELDFTVETVKVIPCALSPTRSNVWFEKDWRRVFGMAGAACSAGQGDKALIYEWDFDTGEEINRYMTRDGFFKAYPFDVSGGGMEDYMPIGQPYRKGHLEPPVKVAEEEVLAGTESDVERQVDGKHQGAIKRLSLEMRKEMDFCYMDDLICIRARDHKVEKVYFKGEDLWESDFTDTVQKTEVFASKVYYIAATVETLPAGKYRLWIRYDGEMYDTGKHFVTQKI